MFDLNAAEIVFVNDAQNTTHRILIIFNVKHGEGAEKQRKTDAVSGFSWTVYPERNLSTCVEQTGALLSS